MKSAEAALAAAWQQLSVLNAEIAESRAGVAQAKADLETARLNIRYTEICSPIDGYVGNRAAQVGAYVTNGAYLLSVIPARGLWVDANFKEDQLALMRQGSRRLWSPMCCRKKPSTVMSAAWRRVPGRCPA